MTSPRLVAFCAMLLLPATAFAQGTQAQRAACTPDVMRLCASHIPDVGAITSCLRSAGPRVSAGCRTAMGGEAPAPAVAQAPPVAPRVAARREPAARVAAKPALSKAQAARPVIARKQAPERVVARGDRRPAARRPDSRRYAEQRPRRHYAGLDRYGSEMAQARYWMRTLGGMGLGSAVAGYLPPEMNGLSVEGIAGMLE